MRMKEYLILAWDDFGRYLIILVLLFIAILCGILGVLFLKSLYNSDFSSFDFTFRMVFLPILGSAILFAIGTFLGFHAFKRMKNS